MSEPEEVADNVISNWKAKNNWERETCCDKHGFGECYLKHYIKESYASLSAEVARLLERVAELEDSHARNLNRCNSFKDSDTKGLLISIRQECEQAILPPATQKEQA